MLPLLKSQTVKQTAIGTVLEIAPDPGLIWFINGMSVNISDRAGYIRLYVVNGVTGERVIVAEKYKTSKGIFILGGSSLCWTGYLSVEFPYFLRAGVRGELLEREIMFSIYGCEFSILPETAT
jgi:hypothetical protein